ncbi:unnamed protein product [Rhizophagus irregularis]|nr:unnamed protein product [Rhizophagus irregularis]
MSGMKCENCGKKYTMIVFKWCKQCETRNIVFEWIPYNKLFDIKEVDKDDFSTVYSAKWKDGPLKLNYYSRKYIRNQKKFELKLKCSHNLQNVVEFLNEVKVYSTNFEIFGISQNPDTKSYIMLNGLPYNQFNDIKEIGTHDLITVYSAKWKDGPLVYDKNIGKYKRNPDELVRLKCSLFKQESLTFFERLLLLFKENTTNEFLNKVKRYFIVNSNKIYGISQI